MKGEIEQFDHLVSAREMDELTSATIRIRDALAEIRSLESHRVSAMFEVIASLHEVVADLSSVAAKLKGNQ